MRIRYRKIDKVKLIKRELINSINVAFHKLNR